MSLYLETAKGIFSWLDSLQIKQREIPATAGAGAPTFQLDHPLDGPLTVPYERNGTEIFSHAGVALKYRTAGDSPVLEVYDHGGIYDPVDRRIQGEHYSASHFALLGAILFQETGEASYLESAKSAIAFHLRTSASEYRPISEWMYHWDFQNYAFALTFRLLQPHLTEDEISTWSRALKSWRTNYKNKLTNWAAMRAWAFAERYDLLGNRLNRLKVAWNLRDVRKARSVDGCFDDNQGLSRPIQYHIFTVAILHRLHSLRPDERLKQWFDEGVEYFLPFVDPDGCFNYLGRGHEQIFGYGAAIYALEAAYQDNKQSKYLETAGKLFDYLLGFRRGDHFPLVLNERPDEERPGWYDYHHLTVYNAFLGAWLGLTHLLKNESPQDSPKRQSYFWLSEPTQTAIISSDNYFAAFYGGLQEYMSEGGVTPHHLWWKDFGTLFSCPGGPTPDRFGQLTPPGSEKNFFAPIAKNATQWFIPALTASSKFHKQGEALQLTYDYGPFEIARQVEFGAEAITFKDEFLFLQDKQYEEFRFFNFPVPVDQFGIVFEGAARMILNTGGKKLAITFSDDAMPLHSAEVLCSAKGVVQTVTKRQSDFSVKKGDTHEIEFKICRQAEREAAS